MKHRTLKLSGGSLYGDAMRALTISQDLVIEERPEGGLLFKTLQGMPVGYVTVRHEAAREIADGKIVLHCSANSVPGPAADDPSLTVRLVTGDQGEHFEMPAMTEPRTYFVGLAGESHYQEAINALQPGDKVTILHEIGNPYDDEALVVHDRSSRPLGYIPKAHWLKGAVFEEAKGASAKVNRTERAKSGMLGVVLSVHLDGTVVAEIKFSRPDPVAQRLAPAPARDPIEVAPPPAPPSAVTPLQEPRKASENKRNGYKWAAGIGVAIVLIVLVFIAGHGFS